MYGIPNMKLEKHIVDRKSQCDERRRHYFVTGVNVGKDVKAAKLMKEYDRGGTCLRSQQIREISRHRAEMQKVFILQWISCHSYHKESAGFRI